MTEIALHTSTNELASFLPDDHRSPAPRRIDLKNWAQEFADVYRVSEALAKTPFVPREMTGKTADVAAAIMKGRELGLDPFDALGSIYIVHGRVGFYAEFLRRRIIQAGHKFRVIESTDNRAVVEGRRKEDPEEDKVRVTFTVEQAKKAGINLGNFPADKLIARATSRICKQHFPDVLAGSLIAEDLIDGIVPIDDGDQASPEPVAAERPAVQRKRPTKKAEAAATQPPAVVKPVKEPDTELAELLGDDEPEPAPVIDAKMAAAGPDPDYDDEPILEAEVIAETPPNPDGITPQQLKKMSAMLTQCGFEDRETRHAFVQTAINRDIESAKDLTKDEASKVIGILADSKPID